MDRRSFLAVAGSMLVATRSRAGGEVGAMPGPDLQGVGTVSAPTDSTTVRGRVISSVTGRPVGGGVVEVILGRLAIADVAVGHDGTFTISDLRPAAYSLRLHPSHRYSIGDGQPDPQSVTLSSGTTVEVDFVVQPAEWFDDFQGYADDADLLANFGNDSGGRQVPPLGPSRACLRDLVHLDPTGGPDGTKAMRYDWWNRSANPEGKGVSTSAPTCAAPSPCDSLNISLARMWRPPTTETTQGWLRLVSKEGEPPDYFTFGVDDCRESMNYKFLRWQFENRSLPRVDLILTGGGPGGNTRTAHKLIFRAADQRRRTGFQRLYPLGNASDWTGQWHTYVTGFRAVTPNWDDVQFWLYRDGQLLFHERIPWGPPGGVVAVQVGANVNAGPDQAQSRWIREVGLYRSRPSVRAGVE